MQAIVTAVRNNNPGRPIPSDSVLSFANINDANAWLLDNPERVLGGYHFQLTPAPDGTEDLSGYVMQVNATTKFFRGSFQEVTFFSALPLQVGVEREIARWQWAKQGKTEPLNWGVSYSQFAHPTTGTINLVGEAIGPMVFAANLFNFIILVRLVFCICRFV